MYMYTVYIQSGSVVRRVKTSDYVNISILRLNKYQTREATQCYFEQKTLGLQTAD